MFRLMLGQHPQIVDLGEVEWILEALESPDGPADPEALEAWKGWLRDRRMTRHKGLTVDADADYPGTFASMLDQLRQARGPDAGVVVAVAHKCYEHVRRLAPNARFIHLTRDPRDVIASWLKLGWVGNAWAGARWWREMQEEWEAVRLGIPEDRRCEVCFEDILRQPEEKLREVSAFMGVAYDPAFLRFHETSTYAPLDPKEAQKWKRKADEEWVRVAEATLGRALERWGYEPSAPRSEQPPPWRELILWADDRVKRQQAKIERFGPSLWLQDIVGRRLGIRSLARKADLEMGDMIQRDLK